MTLTSKNVGFGKAITNGTTPPSNIKQLWYNENVGIFKHYFYDIPTSTWVPLVISGTPAWGGIGAGTGVASQTDLITYLNGNYLSLTGGTMIGDTVFSNGKLLKGTSTLTPSLGSLTYSNTISLSEFHTGLKGMVFKTVKNSNTSVFTKITTGEIVTISATDGTSNNGVQISATNFQSQSVNSSTGTSTSINNSTTNITLSASDPSTYSSFLTIAQGAVAIGLLSTSGQVKIRTDNTTTTRTVQFQDKDGTFAYLSDIMGGITVSNGLVLTGSNITWGGTITGDTAIDGSHILTMGGVTPLNSFLIYTSAEFTLQTTSGTSYSLIDADPVGGLTLQYADSSIPTQSAITITSAGVHLQYILISATTALNLDSNGIGFTTSAYYTYLKTDYLSGASTLQAPDSNGTLLISGGYNILRANTAIDGTFNIQFGNITKLTGFKVNTDGSDQVLFNVNDGTQSSQMYVGAGSGWGLQYNNTSTSASTNLYGGSSGFQLSYFDGTNSHNLIADNNGFGFTNDLTIIGYVKTDLLSSSQTYQMPINSGTLALLSNITGNYIAKTTTYLAVVTDDIIECTTGNFTVTLFTAIGNTGKKIYIKNSGTGTITVACNGGQTIDGLTTLTLVAGDGRILVSNNANWIKF